MGANKREREREKAKLLSRDNRNLFIGDIGGQNVTAPICIINAPESAFSVLPERECRDSNFLLQQRETRERRKRQGHTRAHRSHSRTNVPDAARTALVVKFRSHRNSPHMHTHTAQKEKPFSELKTN